MIIPSQAHIVKISFQKPGLKTLYNSSLFISNQIKTHYYDD